jgi:hypothetical protein
LALAVFAVVGAAGYFSGRPVEGKNPFENPEARTEPAELQLERLAHCTTERQFIARELIADRLTLHEAIDRFSMLSKNNPDYSWRLFKLLTRAQPMTSDSGTR